DALSAVRKVDELSRAPPIETGLPGSKLASIRAPPSLDRFSAIVAEEIASSDPTPSFQRIFPALVQSRRLPDTVRWARTLSEPGIGCKPVCRLSEEFGTYRENRSQ